MHAGQHNFRVLLSQLARFLYELRDGPRPIVAAGNCGRAERAMLIAAIPEGLANQIGVVLVRLASEGVEVDVHGRTVSPSRNVHTRSVSPAPVRCSRSMPRSSRPRPPENWRPSPPENPTSVGVCPTANGNCPPRPPNRSGAVEPSSAPHDQLKAYCASAVAWTVTQFRHDAVAATIA